MYARIFEAAFGWMAVASRGQGVSHVILPSKSRGKVERELGKIAPEHEPSRELISVESDLARYFSGRAVDFMKYPVDMTFSTGFQKRVWTAVRSIPYGRTLTYKEVAEKIGEPRASRAVANALGENPIPIIIPCHRVVAVNGLGGYSGGASLKKRMLKLEGVM